MNLLDHPMRESRPMSVPAPARRRAERLAGALRLPGLAVILCTLAACGGGTGDESGTASASGAREQALASRAAAVPRTPSAAAAPAAASLPVAITNEQLFLWAQATYPQLFPDSPPITSVDHQGRSYAVRSYANGNHLGVSEGQGYGLGPFTNGELVNFGPLSNFAAQVCERVGCGTSPYAQGAVRTGVTVGAPSPTSLTRTVTANQVISATFGGTIGGDVISLAGQSIYLVIEDPLGLFVPGGSLQVVPRGSGWGYDLTLTTGTLARSGRFADKLTIYACLDPQCGTRLAGTPVTLTYDISVR
jgi:hypothetical protein